MLFFSIAIRLTYFVWPLYTLFIPQGTGLPGARLPASSFQLLAKAAGLPAANAVQGGAANGAGTKEVGHWHLILHISTPFL